MPAYQENWHNGQNSLEHVSYSFRWIEVKYFETKTTSGWPSCPFGLWVRTSLYAKERFTGGVYYFFLFDERTLEVDQSMRLSRAPAYNPLSMKIRVWARTSRVCQRGTFSPLILGWGTFWNKQLYVCLLCGLDFSVFWFEKRVFSGNKHRLTGLVLHVVFWVLGLQLLAAYD